MHRRDQLQEEHVRLTASLSLLILTAILLAWPAHAGRGALREPTRVLDTLRADYLEDEQTGRRIGDLRMRLVTTDDAAFLQLHIAASGERVDPVPGYRGVHGANHITARDLTQLTETDRLKMLAMPRGGSGKRFGTVMAGAHGRIPERRLLPDGTLQLDATSAETYRLGIDCTSPPLAAGEHEVYIEVKGLPRLRIDVRVGAFDGRILDVTCLGGHDVRLDR